MSSASRTALLNLTAREQLSIPKYRLWVRNPKKAAPSLMIFLFLFQAEDGIRDYKVTGVQTCALPISGGVQKRPWRRCARGLARAHRERTRHAPAHRKAMHAPDNTGDERCADRQHRCAFIQIGRASLGKECRSRWSPYH